MKSFKKTVLVLSIILVVSAFIGLFASIGMTIYGVNHDNVAYDQERLSSDDAYISSQGFVGEDDYYDYNSGLFMMGVWGIFSSIFALILGIPMIVMSAIKKVNANALLTMSIILIVVNFLSIWYGFLGLLIGIFGILSANDLKREERKEDNRSINE